MFRVTPPAIVIPPVAVAVATPALPAPRPATPVTRPSQQSPALVRPRWASRALQLATIVGILTLIASLAFSVRSRILANPPASAAGQGLTP
jgi:hypothetical protein